jgi:hypothetical protein
LKIRAKTAAATTSEPAADRLLDCPILALSPLLWLIWAAVTRGGWLLRPLGMAVARFDSRPAERWRCGVRAALAWMPATALLLASSWIRDSALRPAWLGWVNWTAALAVILSAILLADASPARLPHERMTGTWVAPNNVVRPRAWRRRFAQITAARATLTVEGVAGAARGKFRAP